MIVQNKLKDVSDDWFDDDIMNYDAVQCNSDRIILLLDGGMILIYADGSVSSRDYPEMTNDSFRELATWLETHLSDWEMIRPIKKIIMTIREE